MPKGPHYHPYSNNSKSSTSSKVDTQPKSLGSSSLDALNSCVNSLNPAKVSPSLPTAKPKADTTVKTVSKFKFNHRLLYIFFQGAAEHNDTIFKQGYCTNPKPSVIHFISRKK